MKITNPSPIYCRETGQIWTLGPEQLLPPDLEQLNIPTPPNDGEYYWFNSESAQWIKSSKGFPDVTLGQRVIICNPSIRITDIAKNNTEQ